MQNPRKLRSISAVCGCVIISAAALSGCGQKDADTAPAAAPSPAPAASTPAAAAPKGGMDAHRATLQAQSDYWRKHGQGLNETPPAKPK